MLFFLDNQQSLGPDSRAGKNRNRGLNENLAREILELHTLGVGGGYSQDDVTSLARIITGWTYAGRQGQLGAPGTFVFNANAHQPGAHAVMGKVYTSSVFHTPNPRVGLMSMGEEETKGSHLTKEVHEALKGSTLNFVGNVEGGDIFTGRVDVIVMDGFTGNVVLKASETLADTLMRLIKEEIQRKNVRKVGAFLSKGAFNAVRHRIDPSEYGGAPLLGVKGCCVIGHGRSNAVAIKHGIRTAADFFTSGVNGRIEAELRVLGPRKEHVTETKSS